MVTTYCESEVIVSLQEKMHLDTQVPGSQRVFWKKKANFSDKEAVDSIYYFGNIWKQCAVDKIPCKKVMNF